MKKYHVLLFIILIISLTTLIGCSQPQKRLEGQQKPKAPTLTAVKTAKAPKIDGVVDKSWKDARTIKIDLVDAGILQGGKGGKFEDGKTQISVKALYDNNNLYMQFQWADPTKSLARGPWIKENGKLVLKSYDRYYEDKLAVQWNIKDSVKEFNQKGCAATCHTTNFTTKSGVTIKKHFTKGNEEIADMWYWKSTRQNSLFGPDRAGLMHDQYIDNAKYNPKRKGETGAGRHDDPGDRETKLNANEEKTQPLKVFDSKPLNGNPYVIVKGYDKTKDFDPAMIQKMEEGDHIPGIMAYQISGDPANISAKGKHAEGMWTLELKRSLETPSENDIQFDDLNKAYFFGIAAFDNSQTGHAYQKGVQRLIFESD